MRYFYLKDHLGSIRVTVDSTGVVAGYDYYYAFGMSMRGYVSQADARYRFTGRERDMETGYDYFGARYYDPWSGRWMSIDPRAGKYACLSPYNYYFNFTCIPVMVSCEETAKRTKKEKKQ